MPNWCYTSYTCVGDAKDIKNFQKLILSLERRKKPLVPNGFGNLWLGCIVKKLGGDWHKVYCRGSITDYSIQENGTLCLSTETAWAEMAEWRRFIESKYPSLKLFFQAEEEGCEYYVTNDTIGTYYPERYLLEDEENESQYFNTLEEACAAVKQLTGKEVADEKQIQTAIDEYCEANEETYVSFHTFECVF